MEIKAVSFDIGHTLIKYNNPLNWKSLYKPALVQVLEKCQFPESENHLQKAISVLSKYNTRENPRENEVNSEVIFSEIFDLWNQPYDLLALAKETFYGFFQAESICYDDTVDVVFTSVDIGFRKPNKAGFIRLLQAFDITPSQMIYIGDEEKDIVGANALGIVSVLINRNGDCPNWSQNFTAHSLLDIQNLF